VIKQVHQGMDEQMHQPVNITNLERKMATDFSFSVPNAILICGEKPLLNDAAGAQTAIQQPAAHKPIHGCWLQQPQEPMASSHPGSRQGHTPGVLRD